MDLLGLVSSDGEEVDLYKSLGCLHMAQELELLD